MKKLVGLLALLWAIGNLFAASVLVINGLAEKTSSRGLVEVGLLLMAGMLLATMAIILLRQCLQLIRSPAAERP